MSKFLKILAPAGAGAASVLTMAYVLADQFVVDIPAPVRGGLIMPANAQETAAPEQTAVAEAAPAAAEESTPAEAEVVMAAAPASGGGFGLGREATPEEIAAWDIDVRPDGLGLPAGSGDVLTGEDVFVEKCAVCHGDFAEGVGRWPVLAGGQGSLQNRDPVKTIGSYWPYLSTVYDYVNRAMPFGEAQSLEPDEIYAITAYLLYMNDLVDEDFELSDANFLEVEMPNAGNFYPDDRATTELTQFLSANACMTDCKESVEITMHASVLDVTPETAEDTAAAVEAAPETAADAAPEAASEEVAAVVAPAPEEPAAPAAEAADPALIAEGESAFRQCKACHQVGEGAANRTGPHLNGLLGRTKGGVEGFRYSNVFADAADAGEVWDAESLSAFLTDPRGSMSGTKMAFRGVDDPEEIAALLAYINDAGAQ